MAYNWHKKHKDNLTFGERAADHMKAVFSTWTALVVILIAMGAWMETGGFGHDGMPFIFLNLCLSCLAALQCFILLIAAKRTDQIASEMAKHDYETNVDAERRIEEMQAALERIEVKLGVVEETA